MADTPPSIAEKVLERIEHEAPHSRAYFLARNAGLWVLAALSVVVGALAVSSVLYRVANVGAALRPGMPPVGDMLRVMPFLWIVLTAAFGYLAYREVRSTRKGYRYELSTLVLTLLLSSFVLGVGFYATGAGFLLDRTAARYMPFHPDLEHMQRERWFRPEVGFLMGTVGAQGEHGMRLADPEQVLWDVRFATTVEPRIPVPFEVGTRVGVRGEILDAEAHVFLACDVRSLEFAGRPGPRIGPGHRMGMWRERNERDPRTTPCEDVRPHTYQQ